MIDPTQPDIGRQVIAQGKIGTLTSFDETFANVRFHLGEPSYPYARASLSWASAITNLDERDGLVVSDDDDTTLSDTLSTIGAFAAVEIIADVFSSDTSSSGSDDFSDDFSGGGDFGGGGSSADWS